MAPIQPDHSGLQTVDNNNYPEVVPEQMLRNPLDRSSSLRSPEVYHTVEENEKRGVPINGYFEPNQHQGAPPEYIDAHGPPSEEAHSPKKDRVCGLRRRNFWILLAVIIIVIVAAAVGGGVGGALSHKSDDDDQTNDPTSNSTSSPIQTKENSGVSLMIPAGTSSAATLYTYYQAENGTIIERQYTNGTLQTSNGQSASSTIVATGAKDGSPLAATSWVSVGATYRQIFFIDNNGGVLTTNTTGSQNWSTPYNVLTGDSAHPKSIALAVCADTKPVKEGLDGLRVYYGSANGGIQEVGMDFSESANPIWHMWNPWPTADAQSGADCTLVDNKNHLYLRNSTSQEIQQWTWDYVNIGVWQIGVSGANNISAGSDIAVTNDGSGNDYIFYQTADGSLERSLYYGHDTSISDAISLSPKPVANSKLTAAYIPSSGSQTSGAAVVFQPQGNATNIYYDIVSRDGEQGSAGAKTSGYIS